MTMREFPGLSEVFDVRDPLSNRPLRGDFPAAWTRRALELGRGEVLPAEPIVVRHYMGGAVPSDVVWTGAALPLIVHARVIGLLLGHRFTGWATYPVEVRGKRDELFADYHGLAVTGRCGALHWRADSRFQKQFPAAAVPYYRGLHFDAHSWDGSDLFAPVPIDGRGRETGHRFALGSVVRAFRKAKVRNLRLRCVLEAETDASFLSADDVRDRPRS
jgi:hypothetical protein